MTDIEEYLKKLEILNNIITIGNKANDIESLMEDTMDVIINRMKFDGGGIYIVDKHRRYAHLVYDIGLDKDFVDSVSKVKLTDQPYSTIFFDGIPIFSENYQNIHKDRSSKYKILSVCSIPLINKNVVIGCLNIASKKRYEFSKLEKEIFKSISEELGTSIGKLVLENDLREMIARVEFYKDLFAHDMNNILQIILHSVEIHELQKLQNIDDADKDSLLKLIKKQTHKGANLIENVQKLSKLDRNDYSLKKINLTKLLMNSIKETSSIVSEKTIEIGFKQKDTIFYVTANELLKDVIDNILLNAITHNTNDDVIISIKVSETFGNYKIEMIDNGIGIADNRKLNIFLRSYDSGTSQGMGLGLSLVKKIMQLFNGDIWVEDAVEGDHTKGSNFIITIPILTKNNEKS